MMTAAPATTPASPTIDDSLPEQAQELWGIAIEVWNTSFLGVSVGQGLAALLIVLIGLVARGLIARWLIAALKRLAERTETTFDDAVVDALSGPMKLVPVIVSLFFALNILQIGAEGALRGHQFVQSLVVIALFWSLHNAVGPLAHALQGLRNALTPVMVDWMTKALRIVFIIVGAAAVLQVWDIPVAGIVAGLGLFGVAIGLGAQDLFKNLIAGILILTEKRFLPGDWVKVDGVVEGTVEEINFRSTVVRRFDKGPVYVPNSKLSDNAVTNFTRMTHRRTYWIIGVRYDTTAEQLREIRDKVLGYVENHPEYAQAPEVSTFMRVDSFGPSSIDFMLYCFTKTTNWGEWLRLKEELAFFIKETVEAAGTEFAFPSTSIYVESGAEVFSPPGDDAAKAVLAGEAGKG
ncbi:mechanosensitive ion channel protein MscS [Maricaulis sp. W15]|uniref:mechanosensitive ion channel family protein n=1 Tax=Maricaulis sp. W15 TaxID=1772333 RepID=UPI0009490484|nr:mechanosensitive ion channel family protein [Maricaulis sp. W15]OLF72300.1 mechanosensitive ion channel protein MscS [Maricaulis sp. W15]